MAYVDAIDSTQQVRFCAPVGSMRPLYATAAGRVLLAFVEPEWLKEYLAKTKLKKLTPLTISSRAALVKALDRIRENRIEVSIGNLILESGSVAVPVFGADGKVVAAFGLLRPRAGSSPGLPSLARC
jgi:IclR family acetate operon transcriptional repressor